MLQTPQRKTGGGGREGRKSCHPNEEKKKPASSSKPHITPSCPLSLQLFSALGTCLTPAEEGDPHPYMCCCVWPRHAPMGTLLVMCQDVLAAAGHSPFNGRGAGGHLSALLNKLIIITQFIKSNKSKLLARSNYCLQMEQTCQSRFWKSSSQNHLESNITPVLSFKHVQHFISVLQKFSHLGVIKEGVLVVQATTSTALLEVPLPKALALSPAPAAAQRRSVHAPANDSIREMGAEIFKAHPDGQIGRVKSRESRPWAAGTILLPVQNAALWSC